MKFSPGGTLRGSKNQNIWGKFLVNANGLFLQKSYPIYGVERNIFPNLIQSIAGINGCAKCSPIY